MRMQKIILSLIMLFSLIMNNQVAYLYATTCGCIGCGHGEYHAVTENYQYAYVYIRDLALSNYFIARITAIHETGHALGLLHVNCDKLSIMPEYITSSNFASYVTPFDKSNLYHVYC